MSAAPTTIPLRHLLFGFAALALLMGSIDSTIVAVAVPTLGATLHAPLTSVGWTLTAYLLVQIVMLPLAGKLADSFGRKRVFLFCLGAFTLGSLLCGLAPSIQWLIAFRAVQAIGGGGLIPSAIGIVADVYKTRRPQAVGLFTSVAPLGAILGPNLGGLILEHYSWRDLFFINVPIGLVVLLGVGLLLRDSPVSHRPFAQDVRGLGLYASAVVLLMTAMSLAGSNPTLWQGPVLWGLFAISLVSGGLFVRHIKRTDNPVVDPAILLKSSFLAANLYSFAFGATTFGLFSFIPFYAVARFGLSPFESGAVLTPRAPAMIATSAIASLLIARTGYRKPMLTGMGLVMLTLLLLSQGFTTVQVGGISLGGFWLMALIILLSGIGIRLASPASNNTALDLAPTSVAAITGIRTMFSLTGGALSVAAIVLVLSTSPDAAHGLEVVFQVLAGIMLLAVLLVFRIPERAQARASVSVSAQPKLVRTIRVVDTRPVGIVRDNIVRHGVRWARAA